MAFRPVHPTDSDYNEPIAEWILDAIPGARELDDAVKAADAAASDVQSTAATLEHKLRAISERGDPEKGPRADVKNDDWNKASDAARPARAAVRPAMDAASHARKARFEFLYGTHDEPGAMDGGDFVAKVEPLYAEASRRAKSHLDALRDALIERDKFALAVGRVIVTDTGWLGIQHDLLNIDGYVEAGLNDEEADAWSIVNTALHEWVAPGTHKIGALRACQAIRENSEVPVALKANLYRNALAAHRVPLR
ncbi:hypothetical protein J2Y69_001387 [Microbacterium resistens]|uniref:DUF222 domain-containing protein n=1 Tax=Microbacterium resistens TaxID=156977 RepID=A0ABU1SB08_9MICO|nr:hypothetical protein [Microbacterium resistens]MDR6866788.1 hypothetical protein [Microbacterium resistens]